MTPSKSTNKEREFQIPIPGTDLNIYAKQYGELSDSMVIFVHGLTGHMDEHLFYNGARYFEKHGISSIRFNLYDWHDDARKLMDCTLETHAHDFNTVLQYLLTAKVKKIAAIGHSYGGPTILLGNHKQLAAIVLWDPSHGDIFADEDEVKYVPELNAYHVNWGTSFLIGSPMRAMEKEIAWDSLTKKIHSALKVVSAGKGELVEHGKKYVDLANGPKQHVVIQSANHNFDDEGAADELYKESASWIQKSIT
ncbi:hypothetical protein CMO91_06215 [Candidatus Woesearchaeota archaeon]|nr:hypothetical protein [Candidatus Woesearchaeota archaeon]|tara:strand:+ start:30 stop:782 length:753 start_codon:yes stop_codon:yes gene_type:complete